MTIKDVAGNHGISIKYRTNFYKLDFILYNDIAERNRYSVYETVDNTENQ